MSEYKTNLILHLDLLTDLNKLSNIEAITSIDGNDWLKNNDPNLLDNAMIKNENNALTEKADTVHSLLAEPFTYDVDNLCLTNTEDAYFLDNNGENFQLKDNDIIKVHTQYYKVTIHKEYIVKADDDFDYDSTLDLSDICGAQPLSVNNLSNTHSLERLKRQLWGEHTISSSQDNLSFLYTNETEDDKKNHLLHEQYDSIHSHFTALSPPDHNNLGIEHQSISTTLPKYHNRDKRRAFSATTKQGNILRDLNMDDTETVILSKKYDSGKSTFQEQSPIDILDELLIYNDDLKQAAYVTSIEHIDSYDENKTQTTQNIKESKLAKILNRLIK